MPSDATDAEVVSVALELLSPKRGVSARAASGPTAPGVEGAGDLKIRYMRRQKLRSMATMII